MPIRELVCKNGFCGNFGISYEWFARTMDKPDPKCPQCGDQMEREISTFNAIWTGTLDRFEEPGHEPHQKCGDGHFAWRVKSSRLTDGGPEKVLIINRQQQKEYCKAEGLVMPDDVNPNAEISPDGRALYTSGMKGQWQTGEPSEEILKTGKPWLHIDE